MRGLKYWRLSELANCREVNRSSDGKGGRRAAVETLSQTTGGGPS